METCEVYGKLYAYLLEVCRQVIDMKFHHEMGVPEIGQEIYEYLNRRLSDRFKKSYDGIIMEAEFLSSDEKGYLLPANGVIDVSNLDVSLSFKIYRLLGGRIAKKLSCQIVGARNYLCHIPVTSLRVDMNQEEFNSIFQVLKKDLEDAGIERELLDWCEMNIFYRR